MKTYEIKDSSRVFWKMTVKPFDVSQEDHTWEVTLQNLDTAGFELSLRIEVQGQYDIEPSYQNIIKRVGVELAAFFLGIVTVNPRSIE